MPCIFYQELSENARDRGKQLPLHGVKVGDYKKAIPGSLLLGGIFGVSDGPNHLADGNGYWVRNGKVTELLINDRKLLDKLPIHSTKDLEGDWSGNQGTKIWGPVSHTVIGNIWVFTLAGQGVIVAFDDDRKTVSYVKCVGTIIEDERMDK